ncbi:MAG: hypothetical protein Q8M17_16435 [Actinomycetota bacterium]|nr:hypothetical protein [Actinomycetota bacterium]
MTDAAAGRRGVAYEAFLGRDARSGEWAELARGTYRVVLEEIEQGLPESAVRLLDVTLLEAEELHEIYGHWTDDVLAWLQARNADGLDADVARLRGLLGDQAFDGFEEGWQSYCGLTAAAAASILAGEHDAAERVEAARARWQLTHDAAVDALYGVLDIAVRREGEACLREIWDLLMGDWYDAHERRLDVRHQDWPESSRQLRMAILDGFHGHLTGPDRLGDVQLIEEQDRWGFRFAPCGSGGRTMSDAASDGGARPGPPYGFAVTTEPHDWAWNTVGVCAYCVHCCLLNELTPIDRLGYPTRVIDPPVWPDDRADPTCTWWVYKDPSLVPEAVYRRVGRERPDHLGSAQATMGATPGRAGADVPS